MLITKNKQNSIKIHRQMEKIQLTLKLQIPTTHLKTNKKLKNTIV